MMENQLAKQLNTLTINSTNQLRLAMVLVTSSLFDHNYHILNNMPSFAIALPNLEVLVKNWYQFEKQGFLSNRHPLKWE